MEFPGAFEVSLCFSEVLKLGLQNESFLFLLAARVKVRKKPLITPKSSEFIFTQHHR
jgi:hypothetical protein